ncbi:hypothetical protein [Photobacterium damselae]|uniref:Uncharacterized protein n=1 Tax=Photobacterium damselae TaxID=38293 RepID=A0ABD6X1I7_PHODM|nr:hypothetical protein [Photobacterium damselae]PSU16253.1 hypothetical protein CTM90_13125 [Photobacterium damselae]
MKINNKLMSKKFFALMLPLASYSTMASADDYLNPHRLDLDGVESIGYPQICIRTNRTAKRFPLLENAKKIANDNPSDTPKELLHKVIQIADSGDVGHAWVDYFYKDENNQIKSVGYGFGSDNNGAERKFSFQRCVKSNLPHSFFEKKADVVTKALYLESKAISLAFGKSGWPYKGGVYSLYGNCSWFAGRFFNNFVSKNQEINYAQPFDWGIVGKKFDMKYLSLIQDLPDPGYIAESISKTINAISYNANDDQSYALFTGYNGSDLFNSSGIFSNVTKYAYPLNMQSYVKYITAANYSESDNKTHYFTSNLATNYEITVYPYNIFRAQFKKLKVSDFIIAAYPNVANDQISMLITNTGDIINSETLEKKTNTALKPYATRISSAMSSRDNGTIIVMLRPNMKQVDPDKTSGVEYIYYNVDEDKVVGEPMPIENLTKDNTFKLS